MSTPKQLVMNAGGQLLSGAYCRYKKRKYLRCSSRKAAGAD
jgi:hypothetical protein